MKKFENYKKNLKVLSEAKDKDLTDSFIISGIINKFSIQFELGWKVLKEILVEEGVGEAKTGSPREILKLGYQTFGWIDEDIWLSMLSKRNNVSHIYDEEEAIELVKDIIDTYIKAFQDFERNVTSYYNGK